MSSPVVTLTRRGISEEPGLVNKRSTSTITPCADAWFNFDLEDDEILAAVHEAELEEEAATQRLNSQWKSSRESEKTKSKELLRKINEKRELHALLEDSFDDACLSSLPIDDLMEQSSTDKRASNSSVIYKDMKELGIVIADKPGSSSSSGVLSRNSSEPSISITNLAVKRPAVMKPSKLFERHNSLPSTQQAPKSIPEVAQIKTESKSITADTSPAKKRFCTPAEIAEKRRLALQRLEATKRRNKNLR